MKSIVFAILLSLFSSSIAVKINNQNHAVVTLVMGDNTGYSSGALALGQSIKDIGSKLARVVLVTPDVPEQSKKQLSKVWKVIEIEHIRCNHKHNLDAGQYDLKGERYQRGLERWLTTCTKFAAWNLTQYDRIIFMDSDTLVVGPIDDALFEYSNASLVASPESFPPDTFNSGFMVITPSVATLQRLLDLNAEIGSTEGGDQGVFNNGLCPHWFTASADDPDCGRLPWLFNVQAAYYSQYKTLRKMNNLRVPSTIHFVSDGKPWMVLMYEYLPEEQQQKYVSSATLAEVGKQVECHVLWQKAFFKATGDRPPGGHLLKKAVALLEGKAVPAPAASTRSNYELPAGLGGQTSPSSSFSSSSSASASASSSTRGASTFAEPSPAIKPNDYSQSTSKKTKTDSKSKKTVEQGRSSRKVGQDLSRDNTVVEESGTTREPETVSDTDTQVDTETETEMEMEMDMEMNVDGQPVPAAAEKVSMSYADDGPNKPIERRRKKKKRKVRRQL